MSFRSCRIRIYVTVERQTDFVQSLIHAKTQLRTYQKHFLKVYSSDGGGRGGEAGAGEGGRGIDQPEEVAVAVVAQVVAQVDVEQGAAGADAEQQVVVVEGVAGHFGGDDVQPYGVHRGEAQGDVVAAEEQVVDGGGEEVRGRRGRRRQGAAVLIAVGDGEAVGGRTGEAEAEGQAADAAAGGDRGPCGDIVEVLGGGLVVGDSTLKHGRVGVCDRRRTGTPERDEGKNNDE
jgi:hypothetical protein